MRNFRNIFLASLALGLAAPAVAQAPAASAAMHVGMMVKDTNGGEVGTVTQVEPGFVTVKTDKHEVRLPAASFAPHEGALLFAMTRDQLNAQTEQALAAAAAKIGPGAAVSDTSGGAVGTVTAADPEWVTVKLVSGTELRLPRSSVAANSHGAVVASTAAQLEAMAKDNAPAATPPK